jgi:hypothetical protein
MVRQPPVPAIQLRSAELLTRARELLAKGEQGVELRRRTQIAASRAIVAVKKAYDLDWQRGAADFSPHYVWRCRDAAVAGFTRKSAEVVPAAVRPFSIFPEIVRRVSDPT